MLEICCGWEAREEIGFHVAWRSAKNRSSRRILWQVLDERELRTEGLYTRPHEVRDGHLWDVISDAPMSTSFACSRFLVPFIGINQWVLFADFADMLFLADPAELFALADDRYAVMVVKRDHIARETTKMDGQIQTYYERKNWSSVILWNWQHHANARLTLEMVNSLPGRDLHRFCWLTDSEIGELPLEWNWLVGVDPVSEVDTSIKPKLLHYTRGLPTMAGYEDGPWANVWRKELESLDSTRGTLRAA